MPVPSVVKITKDGVTFTSSVDRTVYTMRELTRRALQDVGRFVLYKVRREVRGINKYLGKSKNAPKRYQMWVRKKENDLVLGIENTQKGARTAWWADQAELGTHNQPKRAILHTVVLNNIDTIAEIEAQYLGCLNDEASALAAISRLLEGDAQE